MPLSKLPSIPAAGSANRAAEAEAAGDAACGISMNSVGNVDGEAVDEMLDSRIGGLRGGDKVYTVVVVVKEEEVRVVVGKHRHAWIVGRVSKEEAVEMVGEFFMKLSVRGGRREEEEEFMRVGLDGSVRSFIQPFECRTKYNDWVYTN